MEKFFVGDVSSDWEVTNNWSTSSGGAGNTTKPGASDDAILDGAGTGNTACSLSASALCISISVTSGYSATFDMVTFDLSTSGDMTFAGTGIFDCGTGTLTCSGNFDNKDQTTWTRGTSTVVMDGTGKTIISNSGNGLHNLTISGSITLDAATIARLDIRGLLNIDGGIFTLSDILRIEAGADFQSTGTVNGSGTLLFRVNSSITTIGSISCNQLTFEDIHDANIAAGTYAATNVLFFSGSGSDREFKFKAGTYVFEGAVTFDVSGSSTYTIDLATNDASIDFQGDHTISETGGGTLTWNKAVGTGTVTYDGVTTYTDSSGITKNIGDVEVPGLLTLASNMDCTKFTGLGTGTLDMGSATYTLEASGDMDWGVGFFIANGLGELIGATIRTFGIFTANAQIIDSATGTWELQAEGGSAVASGAGSVKNCDARGQFGTGVEIDASAVPWTDEGGNQNWNFGGAPAFGGVSQVIGGGILSC